LTSSTKVGILPGKLVLLLIVTFLIVLSNQLEAPLPKDGARATKKGGEIDDSNFI
jgi:hypothetical protein